MPRAACARWWQAWTLPVQPSGERRRGQEPHARVARRMSADDLGRRVGRAVVHDQNLDATRPCCASAASSAGPILCASLRAGIRIETRMSRLRRMAACVARRIAQVRRARARREEAASARRTKPSAVMRDAPRARDRSGAREASPRAAASHRRRRRCRRGLRARAGSARGRGSARRRSGGRGSR